MTFRRSPDDVAAEREWRRFVDANAHAIADAGLPPAATRSEAEWADFLMHGYLAADPGGFVVDQLSAEQYTALIELAANYFAAGHAFFTPMALRSADQTVLRARFARRV